MHTVYMTLEQYDIYELLNSFDGLTVYDSAEMLELIEGNVEYMKVRIFDLWLN